MKIKSSRHHGANFRDPGTASWTNIDWRHVQTSVQRLQHRITKLAERKQHRRVRRLQRRLVDSLAARLTAVRTVAQDNNGKLTPGIDGIVWTTPERKLLEAYRLRNRSTAQPTKRVTIPKADGGQRSLNIPCMSDRARQALWNLALQPVVEATSDPNSYGFRPYRGPWHANGQLRTLLGRVNSPAWVLDADIEACFDTIDHDWLLAHTPMDRRILRSWLKAGVLDRGNLYPIDKGTPQGGVISPTLMNHTLNGLEHHIAQHF